MLAKHNIVPLLIFCLYGSVSFGQGRGICLEEAIEMARRQSVAAMEAKEQFVVSYWAWKSYLASRLPAVYLYGTLGSFNRSLTLLQSPDDGNMRYVATNYLQNGLGLRARQNITATGGALQLYSDISRIDQFGSLRGQTWYSQPVTLSYSQPLFSYNQFKWDRQIQPKEYEAGRRAYLESMESLTERVVSAYYSLAIAQATLESARVNAANTSRMLAIAGKRLSLGTVTREEYLQLELRNLSDSIKISSAENQVRDAALTFNALTAMEASQELRLELADDVPDISIDLEAMLSKASENSSFGLEQEIDLLTAESDVARARAQRGISMSVGASFGLSKTDSKFRDAYRSPLDQELVSLSFTIPIFDWGEGRGRVQRARAAWQVTKARSQEKEMERQQSLVNLAGRFNSQGQRCRASARAHEIARERYEIMMTKFTDGAASVTDLNNAQSESDAATLQYLQDVSTYWSLYYNIRKETLYDFMAGEDIEIDEKELEDYR